MDKDFAKIIRATDGAQVLFFTGYHPEDEAPTVFVVTHCDGLALELKMSFDTEEKRDEVFAQVDLESADNLRKSAVEMVQGGLEAGSVE
jgi:hypothetical protein